MSPHFRPLVWEAARPNPTSTAEHPKPPIPRLNEVKRPVRIEGQLLFDASHHVCVNGTPGNGDPARVSSWEVHPVDDIRVCKAGCDRSMSRERACGLGTSERRHPLTHRHGEGGRISMTDEPLHPTTTNQQRGTIQYRKTVRGTASINCHGNLTLTACLIRDRAGSDDGHFAPPRQAARITRWGVRCCSDATLRLPAVRVRHSGRTRAGDDHVNDERHHALQSVAFCRSPASNRRSRSATCHG